MAATLKYILCTFSLIFRKKFNEVFDNTIYSNMFVSLFILEIFLLSAFLVVYKTAKMAVINDK